MNILSKPTHEERISKILSRNNFHSLHLRWNFRRQNMADRENVTDVWGNDTSVLMVSVGWGGEMLDSVFDFTHRRVQSSSARVNANATFLRKSPSSRRIELRSKFSTFSFVRIPPSLTKTRNWRFFRESIKAINEGRNFASNVSLCACPLPCFVESWPFKI